MGRMTPTSGGLQFAAIHEDPLRQLAAVVGSDAVATPEALNRALDEARRSQNPLRIVTACGALSDHHLENGRLAAARSVLLEGLVAAEMVVGEAAGLSLERRQAWLDFLAGEPGVRRRIEDVAARCEASGQPIDAIVARLYAILIAVRAGETDEVVGTVHGLLARLPSDGHPYPRVRLLGAWVLGQAGAADRARMEALWVRIWASERDEAPVVDAATRMLHQLDALASRTDPDPNASDGRVEALVAVAAQVSRTRDLQDVLRTIVQSALELVDADRAFVVRPSTEGPVVVAAASLADDPGPPSLSIVKQAMELGREVIAADLAEVCDVEASGSGPLARARSVVSMGLRMAMCVPLVDGPHVVGTLYVDSRRASREQLSELAWAMRAFASHAAAAIVNAEHNEAAARAVRLARETNHDVRNLVSTLRMGLETLREEVPMEDWATDLVGELVRVSELINRQVAGVLSGQREDAAVFALDALVERVSEFSRFDARANGVRIDVRVTPVEIHARADEMERLVSNLVGNALKYAPPETPVAVDLASVEDATGFWALLRVRDHGPGIPVDALEHIFESGVQAAGHREGYGLGLGICRRLAADAGGTIRAANAESGGAIFEVRLPVA